MFRGMFRDGDSLADIERWGSGVPWAEDHTVIARWEAQPAGDRWQVLVGVAYRYVRWRFEDLTVWDEVGPDGWVSRHVEAGADGHYVAAACALRGPRGADTGGAGAVAAYEQIYGVLPESDLPQEAEPYLTPITGREFADKWNAARQSLDPNSRSVPVTNRRSGHSSARPERHLAGTRERFARISAEMPVAHFRRG